MNERPRLLRAIAAVAVTAALVVGVPVLLVLTVGNPWPGRMRMELGDEAAIVGGALAVLAWLVWARLVVAIAIEARAQIDTLRSSARRPAPVPVELRAPVTARGGTGLLAQRLVAAMIVLLPVAARVAPAASAGPTPLRGEHVAAALVLTRATDAPHVPAPEAPVAAPSGTVTVAPGDTLFGLARAHLGDAERWREIFELNRDRPQVDGGRLHSPSALRVGWSLVLPTDAGAPSAPSPAPFLEAATVTVAEGDTLWDLSEVRLAAADAPTDGASILQYLDAVIAANPDVVEDPDLIYAGEQFAFPAIGTASPAPAVPAEAATVAEAPAVEAPAEVAGPPVAPSTPAVTTTTATTTPIPPADPAPRVATTVPASPSPIGLGEAALLSAGVLALLAARRRTRLRSSQPRARVPEPPPETVATERRLRAVDAGERLLRVDVAIRAAASVLVEGQARVAVVQIGADGVVELSLTAPATLPPPWDGRGDHWQLPGSTPLELLADAARSVGAPCVALTQIGVDAEGRDVLADLEALGLLAVVAPAEQADAVVRGIAATLATSVFAEVADLIGVAIDESAFLDHRHGHHVARIDEAMELAASLIGTTTASRQSTFVLRCRHTSGEAWEPAVVLAGATAAADVELAVAERIARDHRGVAVVVAGGVPDAPWALRAGEGRWTLEPLGIALAPVGLSTAELADIHDVIRRADDELVADDEPREVDADLAEPPWSLLVRLLGGVDVVDRAGRPLRFERSKTLELIAWLALHRSSSTRAGARTALWELDVRDATFANVVSEARRAMARHVEPPIGEEWLGRTLTAVLPLHDAVVSDVDLVRIRLDHARLQPPELAIETLRPAVELIRDLPFAGTGYLWPDAEGITSNLVLLATSAATELAGHYLSMGDVDGVFWATGRGLQVLPGHEELIALRMRAHARAGDLSGVRLEWESYERVLTADPWSDGEPAPKLLMLRRDLLS